jgi:hypothetical protein
MQRVLLLAHPDTVFEKGSPASTPPASRAAPRAARVLRVRGKAAHSGTRTPPPCNTRGRDETRDAACRHTTAADDSLIRSSAAFVASQERPRCQCR